MIWNDTLLYTKITHATFKIIDNTYLIIGCTSCEQFNGRIDIYNIKTPINSAGSTNTSNPNNIPIIFTIKGNVTLNITYVGEKFYFESLSSQRFRLIYSSRPTWVSSLRDFR